MMKHTAGLVTIGKLSTVLLLFSALGALVSCSDDSGQGEQVVLSEVTPVQASVGDTLTLTGEGFWRDPSNYRVAFSPVGFSAPEGSRYAVPLSAGVRTARVVVPEGAYTGSLRVESAVPVGAGVFGVGVPHIPSNELDFDALLGEGEVAKLFYTSTEYSFYLAYDVPGQEFLLILFDSADPLDANMTTDYQVGTEDPCTTKDGVAEPAPDPADRVDGAEEIDRSALARAAVADPGPFDRRKREEIAQVLGMEKAAAPSHEVRSAALHAGPAQPTDQFHVYSDIDGSTIDPESYTTVTADLIFEGTRSLLYLDSSTHPTCITEGEASDLGALFESQIFATNTEAFGTPSDINEDGKVVILLTPVVNGLTPSGGASDGFIAGFFMPGDLIPAYMPSGTSNGLEIYYSMVPDPSGIYGNIYEKDRALGVMAGVMAHEFQHMIMFNYRVLIYGNGISAAYMAELWLDEGLAHVAEDLNGFDESNIGRAGLFLADPGDATLIHGGDALDERGASFLFFRYLGDRFGEEIFRRLVQTRKDADDAIASATGVGFKELFADWATAVYFASRGLAPADPKYRYTSIDLAADFDPLYVRTSDLCAGYLTGDVESMGPEFIALGLGDPDLYELHVVSAAYGRMNAVLVRTQ